MASEKEDVCNSNPCIFEFVHCASRVSSNNRFPNNPGLGDSTTHVEQLHETPYLPDGTDNYHLNGQFSRTYHLCIHFDQYFAVKINLILKTAGTGQFIV